MVQDSMRKQGKEGEGFHLESRLTDFFNDHTEQIGEIENVSPELYANINMNALIAAKAFTNVFNDPELAGILSSQPVTKKALQTIATLDAYLEGNNNPAFKAELIEAAKKGSFDSILERIAIERGNLITDERKKEIILSEMNNILTRAKEINKPKQVNVKYQYEKLEGMLGKGVRLQYDREYWEHRNIDENTVLRIFKKEDSETVSVFNKPEQKKYTVMLHLGDISEKSKAEYFSRLVEKVNSVFNTDYMPNIFDLAGLQKGKSAQLDPKNTFSKEKPNYYGVESNLNVKYKKGHGYLIDQNDEIGEFVGSGVFGTASLMTSMAFPQICLPLTAVFAAYTYLAVKKKGLYYLATNRNRKKRWNQLINHYFKSSEMVDNLAQKLEEYSVFGYKEDREKVEDQKKYLNRYFSYDLIKGYTINFTSDSLDDIYKKVFMITEGMKQGK